MILIKSKALIVLILLTILIVGSLVIINSKKTESVMESNGHDREILLTYKAQEMSIKDSKQDQFILMSSTDSVNDTRASSDRNIKNFIKKTSNKKNPYNNLADRGKHFSMSVNINANFDVNNIRNSDIELLAHLIESEAGNEPYSGKVAVGNVVMNRANINGISIYDVIYAKGQFDGINSNRFNMNPSEESKMAAIEVINGKNIVPNAYYFANLKLCNPGFAKISTFVIRIGDHWFFRSQ